MPSFNLLNLKSMKNLKKASVHYRKEIKNNVLILLF